MLNFKPISPLHKTFTRIKDILNTFSGISQEMEVILQSVDRGIFPPGSKGLVENECGNAANTTFPEGKERLTPMKTTMKTLAMLTLSACVITGGAISSFAAAPVNTVSSTAISYRTISSTAAAPAAVGAAVIGHKSSTCGDDTHTNAEILARFKNADGSISFYTVCAEGGEVNGEAALTKLTSASSNFYGTQVYTGTLDNGQSVMTVACISGTGAMTGTTADVRLPNSSIKGYDLYLVGSDGTETKLNVSSSNNSNYSVVRVNMQDGAALIRLVPQSNC